MKKHSFLVSVAAAASALTGTAEAKIQPTEPIALKDNAAAPALEPLPANPDVRYYDIGSDRHAFLMKTSESGQLLAQHRSHASHSSHSSHRSSY
jgi:hypothetical protein